MKQNRPAQSLDSRALDSRADVARLGGRWTPPAGVGPSLTFTWEALERQLVDLASSDLQAELVHRLVARTKVYAQARPPELVLREILTIAALVLEECELGLDPE